MNEGSNILSHGTAISRSGLSSPAKFIKPLLDKESMILDYGCGRGGDVERLNKEGFNVEGYDPHWMDIDLSLKSNYYDIILCTYVLNVLPKSQEDSVLLDIRDKLKDNGTAYISVRRDPFKEGYTSRGFQRKVILDNSYSLKKNSSFEIYALSK